MAGVVGSLPKPERGPSLDVEKTNEKGENESIQLISGLERGSTFNDQKINEKGPNESVEATNEFQGDVYDDSRAIDLGADGREKPIGRFTIVMVQPVQRVTYYHIQKLTTTS